MYILSDRTDTGALPRSSRAELELAAEALAALASLVRSGHSLRRALIDWSHCAPSACVEATRSIGRWIALGGDPLELDELEFA